MTPRMTRNDSKNPASKSCTNSGETASEEAEIFLVSPEFQSRICAGFLLLTSPNYPRKIDRQNYLNKTIFQQDIKKNQKEILIDANKYSEGYYILQISSSNCIGNQKFIK
jgi:hypothetical protein